MHKTHEVVVKEHRFRIGKLPADVGSMLYMRILGAVLARKVEESATPPDASLVEKITPEMRAKSLVSLAMMNGLTLDDIRLAQRSSMLVAAEREFVGDTEQWIAVVTADGRWVNHHLAEDAGMQHLLTIEVLAFSLQDFF